ncbi:PREDICTED: uncharacterized protein LOC109184755 [Ipomoea nil]|uniref:uncharacterized protein LOC109184755 n=1 Tax=Ipomoea nil TaxID=35883 RepID=UPI00090143D4|nr:PREDICTED: uncharacterized protein LOC109184755 [Ipomoea nil]
MESDNHNDLTSLCANLTLADVDDEGIAIRLPNVPIAEPERESEFFAVGRLVMTKLVKFGFFQDTMAAIWQPAMGVTMQQIQSQRYLIRFYHEADLVRILSDGPWSFEQSLLIMRRVMPGEDPEVVPLDLADFWVQIHSLPTGLRSAVVVSAIGSFLGTLVMVDERNFDGTMRTYYRVRVTIDATKPLKKQMKLKKDNGVWVLVDFRYERLPTFCFVCGIIGHGDRVCPKIVQGVDLANGKPYGAWLRAGARRTVPSVGQRWVGPEVDAERSYGRRRV